MKNLIFALSGVLIIGLLVFGFLAHHDKPKQAPLRNPDQISVPDSYTAASIPKGTILLLLAVGLIGILGVSRKEKGTGSGAEETEHHKTSGRQDRNEDQQKLISRN